MHPKYIIVGWVPEQDTGYEYAMRVISSTHPRFTTGTRFDYGFFTIASREGYMIQSFPCADEKPNDALAKKRGRQ